MSRLGSRVNSFITSRPFVQRGRGPFAFQGNSSTRAYEYPWTYSRLSRKEHSRILEIGGGLSGLQFVLSREGHEVHNTDPFVDFGQGGYNVDAVREHSKINRLFGANVVLHPSTLREAHLEPPFDEAYCVSTIEHMDTADIETTLNEVSALLIPGGQFVLTIDLFLNVRPFTTRETNRWGQNVSVAWIEETLGFDLMTGDRRELYGYDAFSADWVLSHLEDYAVNPESAQLAQLVTFQAPASS